MKITETTPKVERKFTLELSEIELQSIEVAMGQTHHGERSSDAMRRGICILDNVPFHNLYCTIHETLKN